MASALWHRKTKQSLKASAAATVELMGVQKLWLDSSLFKKTFKAEASQQRKTFRHLANCI